MSTPLTYGQIFSRAWPIILANAAVPMLGLIDTAVIGNAGTTQDIGAIALGALIFNFVYWSFGFLRMSTTGFVAQAAGANQWQEMRLVLGRALFIALVIALLIISLHRPLGYLILQVFQASSGVESQTLDYFNIRIWGAPATLATFALLGVLVGLGKSTYLLLVQVFLNGLNALLDIYFAGYLGWGVEGIAWGTIIAEYCTVMFAGFFVLKILNQHRNTSEAFFSWQAIIQKSALLRMLKTNSDILIRTILLVFSFALFTNESAKFSDSILAANHILLQFVSFSAFFLDGYAFVAESIVGTAIGAKQRLQFIVGVYRSSLLAAATGVLLASATWVLGDIFIRELTDIATVREITAQYLPLACFYILVSVGAFQLDGIFIGAVRSAEMRNAAMISTGGFVLCVLIIRHTIYSNDALWLAFISYVVMRALSLLYYYPRITKSFQGI